MDTAFSSDVREFPVSWEADPRGHLLTRETPTQSVVKVALAGGYTTKPHGHYPSVTHVISGGELSVKDKSGRESEIVAKKGDITHSDGCDEHTVHNTGTDPFKAIQTEYRPLPLEYRVLGTGTNPENELS
jgi:mannose-6-phosphate isomerase-like protein (cupin superfamily)